MRDLFILLGHLLTTIPKLLRQGGVRTVAAENALVKQQLLVAARSRRRTPNFSALDRFLFRSLSLRLGERRVPRVAIILKPSTLLSYHEALKKRKDSLSPDPPGHALMDQFARRIVGFAVHGGDVDGIAVCRMFNEAVSRVGLPGYLSSDHAPLFHYHRLQANLRVLGIAEIETVPYVPLSHPFVERLIGTTRREFLDHTLFWNARDLNRKLGEFKEYYNGHRAHTALGGDTPAEANGETVMKRANPLRYRWKIHCRGLYELPFAA